MNTLKPCPFCGGTKICTEKGINLNYCDNCSAESNVERWNTRPIEDDLRKRIAELEALVNVSEGLYERIYEQAARIAELEAENIRLGIEYQRMRLALGDIAINSKRALKESPNDTQKDETVYRKDCEACGGDGTLLLVDNYKGQATALVECPYCNGTGYTDGKEREK